MYVCVHVHVVCMYILYIYLVNLYIAKIYTYTVRIYMNTLHAISKFCRYIYDSSHFVLAMIISSVINIMWLIVSSIWLCS